MFGSRCFHLKHDYKHTKHHSCSINTEFFSYCVCVWENWVISSFIQWSNGLGNSGIRYSAYSLAWFYSYRRHKAVRFIYSIEVEFIALSSTIRMADCLMILVQLTFNQCACWQLSNNIIWNYGNSLSNEIIVDPTGFYWISFLPFGWCDMFI